MNNGMTLLLAFSVAVLTNGQASGDNGVAAPGAVTVGNAYAFEMIRVKQQVPDNSSPIGYWDIDKSYPVFTAGARREVVASMNAKVAAVVRQYACSGKGDEAFVGEVTLANERLFSMRYEAMWMCAAMPAPDSTVGTLNINMKNGSVVSLRAEFAHEGAYQSFVKT